MEQKPVSSNLSNGPSKYVCIHGHFYQPPRENPFLGELEREASAAPAHDWTERISDECYRANAAARVVDSENRALYLVNNYRRLSFNVGPTLFKWIEGHDPWLYEAILAADRESAAAHDGHGNAIAQAYNHIILPLADERDKVTQVRWGIREFEWRFGRQPEGMWLPETAVDLTTLKVLADAGIRFTILAPHQAARYREKGEERWRDASDGQIPIGHPYSVDCGGGHDLAVFFYDARLAHGIAFERLLGHSSRLIEAIDASHERHGQPGRPCLAHTATDGESYGHHFQFGDMALAHAFRELEQADDIEVTNYAAFLAQFPPEFEAEIVEPTSWSCAHGVGRWATDCGCRGGRIPGGHQRWRAPLRAALNRLRDRLRHHYEREMGRFCADPWEVRDAYIEVLLDRNWAGEFVLRYAGGDLTEAQKSRFFVLLEMQRATLLMFTSCGWFFDDIADLEGLIILRQAARAIQLAERTGAEGVEASFVEDLAEAPANAPDVEDGADIYIKKVKPQAFGSERVVANYAIHTLVKDRQSPRRFRCFNIEPKRIDPLGSNPIPCVAGHAEVTDRRTRESASLVYAVLHFGGLDFRCSVKHYRDDFDYDAFLTPLRGAVEEQSTVEMMRTLDETFGPLSFSLHDAFADFRRLVAMRISREPMKVYTELQRHLFQTYRPLLQSLHRWDIELPSDLKAVISRVLSEQLNDLVREFLSESATMGYSEEGDGFAWRVLTGRLRALMQEREAWGVELDMSWATRRLGGALVEVIQLFLRQHMTWAAEQLHQLVRVCSLLELTPRRWELQTDYFQLVQKARSDERLAEKLAGFRTLLSDLDEFLHCRFGERFLDRL